MLKILKWFLILTSLGGSAHAQFTTHLDMVVNDFAPLDGYVVGKKGDDYIVDIDESRGLQSGDLLAVLGRGEPVVHPITGKIIGNLDTVKGVLRVNRLKSGFSLARVLNGASSIAVGDPVCRYSGVQAFFWDLTGEGKPLWRMLQQRLPDLSWKDYLPVDSAKGMVPQDVTAKATVGLHFILTTATLEVVDSSLNRIHAYSVSISRNDNSALPTNVYRFSRTSNGVNRSAVEGAKTDERHRQPSAGQGAPDFTKPRSVGEVAGRVLMSDFVGKDGGTLLAATDGSAIEVFTVTEQVDFVTKADTGIQDRILYLKWWIPAAGNALYLSATIWSENRPYGMVFRFEGNGLRTVLKRPDCMLGSFDLDSDGRPERLFSQQFNPDSFFGHRIHELVHENGTIHAVRSELKFPRDFTLSGSQFADLTGSGARETIVVRNGVLRVYSENQSIYATPRQMGGSLSVLTYPKDPSFKDFMLTSIVFELSPIAIDMDEDGAKELIAVSSHHSTINAPGAYTRIEDIHLVSLNGADGKFSKNVLAGPMENPVQGLGVVDKRLFYILTEPGSGSGKSGMSRVFEIPLDRSAR